MLKKLILFIFISLFANATSLKTGDKISTFSLPNQFDKIHIVGSETSIMIVTFQKETANIVTDFLNSKNSDFLEKNHTVFINNISNIPSVIIKMFTIPKLRDYKYDVLLIYNENNKKFLEEENKMTIYFVKNAVVVDVKYISTKYELERVFSDSF